MLSSKHQQMLSLYPYLIQTDSFHIPQVLWMKRIDKGVEYRHPVNLVYAKKLMVGKSRSRREFASLKEYQNKMFKCHRLIDIQDGMEMSQIPDRILFQSISLVSKN